jgi:hypothetical protein
MVVAAELSSGVLATEANISDCKTQLRSCREPLLPARDAASTVKLAQASDDAS